MSPRFAALASAAGLPAPEPVMDSKRSVMAMAGM
jgi:hypothetical protein